MFERTLAFFRIFQKESEIQKSSNRLICWAFILLLALSIFIPDIRQHNVVVVEGWVAVGIPAIVVSAFFIAFLLLRNWTINQKTGMVRVDDRSESGKMFWEDNIDIDDKSVQ